MLTELRIGRGGTRTVGRKRTYVRKFRLISDGLIDETLDARTYPGVPQILTPHPVDTTAFCYQIDVDQPHEDRQLWNITCHYKNHDIDTQQPGGETAFAQQRPKTSWTSAKYTEPVELAYYISGNPAPPPGFATQLRVPTNSYKQPFNPPMERDQTRKILVLTRAEASYDPDIASQWEDKINSAQIRIAGKTYAKHTGKVETITADDAFESGQHFWIVRYEIHHLRSTWNRTIIDSGIDDSGRRFLLNGAGRALTPAEIQAGATPGNAVYRIYEEADFSTLNLPQTV